MFWTHPPAHTLNARDLCERLTRLYIHSRDRLRHADWNALKEAMRRVQQHERVVRDVVPDLEGRLAALEREVARDVRRE